MSTRAPFQDILKDILSPQGFSHFGWTELQTPLSIDIYKSWIQDQKHGEMAYLETHLPSKENPLSLHPRARSAIVIAQSYVPHPKPLAAGPCFPGSRVALYAAGEDYHYWFKEKLQKVCDQLKEVFPQEEFVAFTDSGPILERDLAFQAHLGWFGKNTCLIHPKKGSLFLLGEIISSLSTSPADTTTFPDMCGTCTRCIDECPTQAITAERSLDARKCISYLTIESRKVPPIEIREKMGDWLFGCDVCQTVCPWNQKTFKSEFTKMAATPSPDRATTLADLRFLLTASGKQIEKKVQGTPLKRAGPFGLRKNALIVAANIQAKELKPEIQKWTTDEKLKELAEWSLHQLNLDFSF